MRVLVPSERVGNHTSSNGYLPGSRREERRYHSWRVVLGILRPVEFCSRRPQMLRLPSLGSKLVYELLEDAARKAALCGQISLPVFRAPLHVLYIIHESCAEGIETSFLVHIARTDSDKHLLPKFRGNHIDILLRFHTSLQICVCQSNVVTHPDTSKHSAPRISWRAS
jgi:hypothetical protein